jgi:putative endonuclease
MIVRPDVEARHAMPDAYVYLLRCRDGSLYCGWTSDLDRRLAAHRSGRGSRYTASRLPVALALAQPMADRGTARREEARIKRLTRTQKLALVARAHADAAPVGSRETPGPRHGRRPPEIVEGGSR